MRPLLPAAAAVGERRLSWQCPTAIVDLLGREEQHPLPLGAARQRRPLPAVLAAAAVVAAAAVLAAVVVEQP
jgi:hypothetical protein